MDECELGTDNCVENMECVNTQGGFDCVCATGYAGENCPHCEFIYFTLNFRINAKCTHTLV